MLRKIVPFLSFLALGLILVHACMPHQHHADLSEKQHLLSHRNAHGLGDWLQVAFHLDPGSGHLESFFAGAAYALAVVPTTGIFFRPIEVPYLAYPAATSETAIQKALHRLPPFRGPPQLA